MSPSINRQVATALRSYRQLAIVVFILGATAAAHGAGFVDISDYAPNVAVTSSSA